MSAKSINMTSIFSQAVKLDKRRNEREVDLLSLEAIPENNRPVEDFRALVSNLQTIEETMTARAKNVSQKIQLLCTWVKLKELLCNMTERLEKDIENTRRIEQQIEAAKEQARAIQQRSGIYSRLN